MKVAIYNKWRVPLLQTLRKIITMQKYGYANVSHYIPNNLLARANLNYRVKGIVCVIFSSCKKWWKVVSRNGIIYWNCTGM